MADEHELSPAERLALQDSKEDKEEDLYTDIATSGFYINRELAFGPEMRLGRILQFLDRYSIPYQDPYLSNHPNRTFWAMCYTCILISGSGGEVAQERATIWMAHHSQIGYNIRLKTYRDGQTTYTLHPLLSRKRPNL